MLEDDQHIIDIDEVVREMNSAPKEPRPEAVSGAPASCRPALLALLATHGLLGRL
jgi:hypothetical protein